ncbi:uncharacterized protein LOC118180475 [Stegodyphus dumicola]|uniref:uncharacterized protein LOC118180475 n=1 Tax=Stegodyphus dumicola TaxID=202533 RepID=UPI0015B2D644|nr:uncharacterized protein LOC118180475 [Stegodyphus dumicola]
MYRMPQFKVVPTRKRKIMISRKIKEKLANKDSIAGEEVFMFNLPNSQDHQNHLMGNMAAVIEPIDARVRHFIASKVKNGKCNATVIAELLEVYVSTELGETDKTRRRFYPEMEAIRKIISQAKSDIRTSKIDQENTEMLINSWDTSKCSVFFRPCTENTYDGTEPNDFTDSKLNLLFVYQSEEMKNLYVLYGSNLVLLDATYRTCKYALPLYFLVVKTNVNYQIVSIIITQNETAKALEEALIIIKNWSPLVRPKYGMVDFAMEEITSLENVFTGIKVFICSFHREQAWSRWASKKKNAVVPKEELLCKLRAIANAPTQDEMVAAIEVLKSWNQYEAVKDYFELTWFKEIERWALAYKPNDLFINSNNGVERLNEELKYRYLQGYKNCMLSEIIKILVEKFLPERYRIYVRKNLSMLSQARLYNEHVPNYLINKPKWLIDHIKTKLRAAEVYVGSIKKISHGFFKVSSETKHDAVYSVTFDEQKQLCQCTCLDFRRNRLLCKHIVFAGMKFPAWSLECTAEWLFSTPIFKVDEDLVSRSISGTRKRKYSSTETPSGGTSDNLPTISEEATLSKKRNLINECDANYRSIRSLLWNLDSENLHNVANSLKEIFESASKTVMRDENTGLPLQIEKKKN